MERSTKITELKDLFKENFLGKTEITPFLQKLGFSSEIIDSLPLPDFSIPFSKLKKYSKEYILIWGLDAVEGIPLTLRLFREKLGCDPDFFEPCFYNQDWYLSEKFMDFTLENKWYLIKKDVFEEFRSVQPGKIQKKKIAFPSALLCGYTFFSNYFYNHTLLWEYDFVWCSDFDHNGDRIYVGKYRDIDQINKNGFSIHRHLNLRPCYSCIDSIA